MEDQGVEDNTSFGSSSSAFRKYTRNVRVDNQITNRPVDGNEEGNLIVLPAPRIGYVQGGAVLESRNVGLQNSSELIRMCSFGSGEVGLRPEDIGFCTNLFVTGCGTILLSDPVNRRIVIVTTPQPFSFKGSNFGNSTFGHPSIVITVEYLGKDLLVVFDSWKDGKSSVHVFDEKYSFVKCIDLIGKQMLTAAAESSEGKLITIDNNSIIYRLDIVSGIMLQLYKLPNECGLIKNMAIFNNSVFVASASANSVLVMSFDGRLIRKIGGHDETPGISGVQVAAGKLAISGLFESSFYIKLFDHEGVHVHSFMYNNMGIAEFSPFCFAPSGHIVVMNKTSRKLLVFMPLILNNDESVILVKYPKLASILCNFDNKTIFNFT